MTVEAQFAECRAAAFSWCSDGEGGHGLGLAIVQRAVEAHRGMVLVDSNPGKGTTFTIFFPARRAAEEAA